MSQGNYVIDNLAGAGFRAAINGALAAIATNNSGATEPATMYAHQWWADTSANMLKRRNAGNTAWVSVMSLSLAISNYMETVLGATNAATARTLLNAFSSSGGNLSGALNEARTTVASHATAADIWDALGNSINWTGTVVTTTFPNAPQSGAKRWLHCAGACSFTNSPTLAIQGDADFTAEAGDVVLVEAISVSTFRLIVFKKNGQAVKGSGRAPGDFFETASPRAPAGSLLVPVAPSNISRTSFPALFNAITIQTTGSTTNANNTLTAVGSTAGVEIGYPISGPGIQAGTTVTGKTANTITMSLTANATAAGVAIVIAPWGVGDGSTTFGMPYCPAGYSFVQMSANLGTATVGEVIAHTHPSQVRGGSSPDQDGTGRGSVVSVTGSTGGPANLAAGMRVTKCIQYL